jgi:hypothetical protein
VIIAPADSNSMDAFSCKKIQPERSIAPLVLPRNTKTVTVIAPVMANNHILPRLMICSPSNPLLHKPNLAVKEGKAMSAPPTFPPYTRRAAVIKTRHTAPLPNRKHSKHKRRQ